MKKISLVLLLSIVVLGCASTTPTPRQLTHENFGRCPSNYREQIVADIGRTLIDPSSALYKFGIPEKYVYERSIFGHVVVVYVNAKNRFGGYTGDKLRNYMCFSDGTIGEINQILTGIHNTN